MSWRNCVVLLLLFFFFFFSSRRRHTRLVSDWSSDVCSSDLGVVVEDLADEELAERPLLFDDEQLLEPSRELPDDREIGRASCRERVEITEGVVTLKKKNKAEREGCNGMRTEAEYAQKT